MKNKMRLGAILFLVIALLGHKTQAQSTVWPDTIRIDGSNFYLWVPPGVKQIRGVVISFPVIHGATFTKSAALRATATEQQLAVIHSTQNNLGPYGNNDDDALIQKLLHQCAALKNMPEFIYAPWLTFGHSASGPPSLEPIFWRPERSFGVITFKTGPINQPGFVRPGSMVHGVPMLALSGQYETFPWTPKGSNPNTQWWVVRRSITKWRDAGLLMSMYVEPGAGHGSWSDKDADLLALYVKKAAQYRLPTNTYPAAFNYKLNDLDERKGWLSDTIIHYMIDNRDFSKNITTPFVHYNPDKRESTYWHMDKEMAEAWVNFHSDADKWRGGKLWVFTSLSKTQTDGQFSVYPNPASDALTIKLGTNVFAGNLTINIYDALGRLVKSVKPDASIAETGMAVPITDLQAGVYTIELKDGNRLNKAKFVKN